MSYSIRIQEYKRGVPLPYFQYHSSEYDDIEDAFSSACTLAEKTAYEINDRCVNNIGFVVDTDEINYTAWVYDDNGNPVIEFFVEEM